MKKISGVARSRFARLLILLIFLIYFGLPNTSFAEEKFETSYNVTYDVSNNQNTKVTLDIDLKNTTSDYYAASYTVQTGFKKIKNISASDSGGALKYETQENDKGIGVSFRFNKNVVGINNTQSFKVSFDTEEVAKSNGNIWEVNIPGVTNQSDFNEFNVVINVPESFGNPVIIKPHVKNLRISNNILRFSKEDLAKSGISIAYGSQQIYSFDLKYHLNNGNLFPINTEIAIPSDNNYQEVRIDDISPAPLDVEVDNDGNWLAKYRLLPSQTVDVTVRGAAKVSYSPKKEALTAERRATYLKAQPYWESSDSVIKSLGRELKTPEAIYRYVVKNLSYDTKRIKDVQVRAGAKGVLMNKKSAVCLEFTDLFIALSRAAGIPARAVEGYANTNNSAERPLSLFKDVLHSWPQYYDNEKGAWIMVDPTWENTTEGLDYFNVFDFDHLAFVIKGEESQYPVPAGGYKIPGEESTKDVEIKAYGSFREGPPVLTAVTRFSDGYLGGFPIEGEVEIHNLSGVISPNQTFNVSSGILNPHSQDLYFEKIPPYGKETVKVKFLPRPILTNERDTIKIRIGKKTFEEQVVISPFYKNIFFLLGGIIIGSITIILLTAIRKSRRLHVS